ncbi:unnamed protein product, partial [Mesorhabditis belari]|uniref:C2H2-type domain-containing protein n=1 Tax=Mesorhabditis belari TaxID=2138241 RepID=A0AAF3EBK7_9BILA
METDFEESCILVECSQCGIRVDSPEELCDHTSKEHNRLSTYSRQFFHTKAAFQHWLSRIEGGRAEYAGIVASASSDGLNFNDREYYLLCGKKASICNKRRRTNDIENTSDSEPEFLIEENCPLVSCTAFVHVCERINGSVDATYCLSHNVHSPLSRRKTNYRSLKRTSSMLDENDDEDLEVSCSSSSACSSAQSSPLHPWTETNTTNGDTQSSLYDLSAYDLTSVNSHITARLDSTADRLRTLTKVLAKLAVDVQKCERIRNFHV